MGSHPGDKIVLTPTCPLLMIASRALVPNSFLYTSRSNGNKSSSLCAYFKELAVFAYLSVK